MSNAAPHHSIYALAYLPDGQRVVTGSGDGTIRIWNAENGEQEGTSMTHGKIVTSLAVTRDGTKIISGDEGGNIKVWGIESHRVVKEWTHPDSCTTLSLSSDDRLVVVAGGLTVGIYTVEGRQVKNSIKVGSEVFSVSFSPDRRKLACGTEDAIWVFEVGSSTLVLGPLQGHKNWISCLRWSLDGRRLFSGSFDQTIRLWDSETGSLVGKTRRGHTDGIISLSLSPDGSKLASASWDRTVRFWNTTSHPPMIPIGQHLQLEDDVTEICFSPSGESVATAGSNGKMYFWRVPSLKTVESRPSSPSSDRSRIVVQSVHESLSQPNESDPSLIGLDNFEPPPDGETSSQVSLSRPEENDQNPIDLPNDDEPHSVRHSAPVSLSRPEENDQSSIDLPNDEEPHSVGHSAPVSLSRPEENDQSPIDLPNDEEPHSVRHSAPASILHPDESDTESLKSSTASDEVDSILPDLSLGSGKSRRVFEQRLRELVNLATSQGLHVPLDLIPSCLPLDIRDTPLTGLERILDVDWNSMHVSRVDPSTSVFRSTSIGDPNEGRKNDSIKRRMVVMLRVFRRGSDL